jgi:hypothetical protein
MPSSSSARSDTHSSATEPHAVWATRCSMMRASLKRFFCVRMACRGNGGGGRGEWGNKGTRKHLAQSKASTMPPHRTAPRPLTQLHPSTLHNPSTPHSSSDSASLDSKGSFSQVRVTAKHAHTCGQTRNGAGQVAPHLSPLKEALVFHLAGHHVLQTLQHGGHIQVGAQDGDRCGRFAVTGGATETGHGLRLVRIVPSNPHTSRAAPSPHISRAAPSLTPPPPPEETVRKKTSGSRSPNKATPLPRYLLHMRSADCPIHTATARSEALSAQPRRGAKG